MVWRDPLMDVIIAAIVGAVATILCGFVALVVSNMKGYKDVKAKIGNLKDTTLSGQHAEIERFIEQKTGKLDDTSLSAEHKEIKDFIEQKTGKLANQSLAGLIEQKIGKLDNTTLSGQNNALLSEIRKMQDKMDSDRKQESLKRQQLTGDQATIERSIAALSDFAKIMTDLNAENMALKAENQQLKQDKQMMQQKFETFPYEHIPRENPDESLGETLPSEDLHFL